MQNSPWNLLQFMALPVVLAETAAITELWLAHAKNASHEAKLRLVNHCCGILGSIAFIFIDIYLISTFFIPLAQAGEFRTWVDVVAIASYLLAGIPMVLMALANLRILFRNADQKQRDKKNVVFLAAFLVLSHIAIIFGMVDPGIAGYEPKAGAATEMHRSMPMQNTMPMMDYSMPMNHDMGGMNHSHHHME